jgi:cytidine deaminase
MEFNSNKYKNINDKNMQNNENYINLKEIDLNNQNQIFQIGEILKKIVKKSYSPYSNFPVSALLITEKNIYEGVNIENRSYSLTICAERVAIFNAILNEDFDFKYLFIYGEKADYPLPPCGACRQVISEFGKKDMKIIIFSKNLSYIILSLEQIYPFDSLHDLIDKK